MLKHSKYNDKRDQTGHHSGNKADSTRTRSKSILSSTDTVYSARNYSKTVNSIHHCEAYLSTARAPNEAAYQGNTVNSVRQDFNQLKFVDQPNSSLYIQNHSEQRIQSTTSDSNYNELMGEVFRTNIPLHPE